MSDGEDAAFRIDFGGNEVIEPVRPPMWRRCHDRIRGWRTLIAAGVLAGVPELLDYFHDFDWQTIGIKPHTAALVGMLFAILRLLTRHPVGGPR